MTRSLPGCKKLRAEPTDPKNAHLLSAEQRNLLTRVEERIAALTGTPAHPDETGIVVNCVRPDTLEVGVSLISFHFISFIYIDVYILFLHFKMLSVCLLACLFVCVCFCQ